MKGKDTFPVFILIFICIWLLFSCGVVIKDVADDMAKERAAEAKRRQEVQKIIDKYEANHEKVNGKWVPKTTPTPTAKPSGSSGSSKKSKSYSYGSSRKKTEKYKAETDPDDHDIEGYYEDNKDDFEDIDDAYDAFLDDEDAWDDY